MAVINNQINSPWEFRTEEEIFNHDVQKESECPICLEGQGTIQHVWTRLDGDALKSRGVHRYHLSCIKPYWETRNELLSDLRQCPKCVLGVPASENLKTELNKIHWLKKIDQNPTGRKIAAFAGAALSTTLAASFISPLTEIPYISALIVGGIVGYLLNVENRRGVVEGFFDSFNIGLSTQFLLNSAFSSPMRNKDEPFLHFFLKTMFNTYTSGMETYGTFETLRNLTNRDLLRGDAAEYFKKLSVSSTVWGLVYLTVDFLNGFFHIDTENGLSRLSKRVPLLGRMAASFLIGEKVTAFAKNSFDSLVSYLKPEQG